MTKLTGILYRLYLVIAQKVRSNRLFIRFLFKVRIDKSHKNEISWDFTTLVLRSALRKRLNRQNDNPKNDSVSILEIGIGKAALLCIYLYRTFGIAADGIDIVSERVESATQIADFNNVALTLFESDLFENVKGRYDYIFWNSAYIPTDIGTRFQLTKRSDIGDSRAWDGGDSGTKTISRFLEQAPAYLSPGGEVLLGLNRIYVSDDQVSTVIESSQLVLLERVTRPFNPSAVYILRYPEPDSQRKTK